MSYAGKININNVDYPIASSLYGECTTTGTTAAKVVSLANFDALIEGVQIAIKFTYSNTAASPTLNVNATGAKAIKTSNGGIPGTTVSTSWRAGSVVSFVYSGGSWVIVNSATESIKTLETSIGTETTRATAAEDAINSTITNYCRVKTGTISMAAADWTGDGPYTQTVTVTGPTVTANSLIELQPDATVFSHMYTVGVAAIFVTNNSGTLTATAIGQKPTDGLTVQCSVTEVVS